MQALQGHFPGRAAFLGAMQGAISLLPDYLLFLCPFTVDITQLREARVPEPAAAVAA